MFELCASINQTNELHCLAPESRVAGSRGMRSASVARVAATVTFAFLDRLVSDAKELLYSIGLWRTIGRIGKSGGDTVRTTVPLPKFLHSPRENLVGIYGPFRAGSDRVRLAIVVARQR